MSTEVHTSNDNVKPDAKVKCELCNKMRKHVQEVSNPNKIRRLRADGIFATKLCIECSLMFKASTKNSELFKIPKLRWAVDRALRYNTLSEVEIIVERAEKLKRSIEKDARIAMEKLQDCAAQLNDVVISETTIKAAYSKLLWESYPERRARADREISRFQLRIMIFGRDSNKCRRCGNTENLAIDHIIPVAAGGDESLTNLQTLCKSCNSAKGAKLDFK